MIFLIQSYELITHQMIYAFVTRPKHDSSNKEKKSEKLLYLYLDVLNRCSFLYSLIFIHYVSKFKFESKYVLIILVRLCFLDPILLLLYLIDEGARKYKERSCVQLLHILYS